MKQVKLSVLDHDSLMIDHLYEGELTDETIRYIDHLGYRNLVSFKNDRILIKRNKEKYHSYLYLSKTKGLAKVKDEENEFEIDVKMLDFTSDEKMIRAVYDTGQVLEVRIELIKE